MSARNRYLFEHLTDFALLFVQKLSQTLHVLFFLAVLGFITGEGQQKHIDNVTQRKPRHAKFKSHSCFSRANGYSVTREQ